MQSTSPIDATLPAPDHESLAHSQRVVASVRQIIGASGGSVSFAEYMHHVLYAPGLGYYSAGARKFGDGGDYVTAPEASPLFGRVLAAQCAEVMPRGYARLLELGAGSGALAVEVLQSLSELGVTPLQYQVLEVSADLQERQRALIASSVPSMAGSVEWIDSLPEPFDGVVIANEVADALPVERFVKADGEVLQLRVTADGEGFAWRRGPAPAVLTGAVRQIEADIGHVLPDGYESEVSLALPGWIGDIAHCLRHGFVFLFDYGVSRREYYAADRDAGWLRCHFRHRAHSDPFAFPGIQDLTSWVDFSQVAASAAACGLDVSGYVTQARFLLDGGIAESLADFDSLDPAARIDLSRQVKQLTLPGEMGENFKCIGLSRGPIDAPAALRGADRAHVL